MHPVLAEIVEDVAGRVQENPGEAPVSSGTDLSLEILRSGEINEFDEHDLLSAAQKVGMSPSEAAGWLESLASWWV